MTPYQLSVLVSGSGKQPTGLLGATTQTDAELGEAAFFWLFSCPVMASYQPFDLSPSAFKYQPDARPLNHGRLRYSVGTGYAVHRPALLGGTVRFRPAEDKSKPSWVSWYPTRISPGRSTNLGVGDTSLSLQRTIHSISQPPPLPNTPGITARSHMWPGRLGVECVDQIKQGQSIQQVDPRGGTNNNVRWVTTRKGHWSRTQARPRVMS